MNSASTAEQQQNKKKRAKKQPFSIKFDVEVDFGSSFARGRVCFMYRTTDAMTCIIEISLNNYHPAVPGIFLLVWQDASFQTFILADESSKISRAPAMLTFLADAIFTVDLKSLSQYSETSVKRTPSGPFQVSA